MHLRPRCSEWLPLKSQQLRLRSLQRIQALNMTTEFNIKDEDNDIFSYYTLHYTKEDEAFYTSEPLPLRHKQLKWAEINSEEVLKSNANCVCIKVWAQTQSKNQTAHTWLKVTNEPVSSLSREMSKVGLSPNNLLRPPDKLLFTWGVYFSGLMLLNLGTEKIEFQTNTLIFQLNANYFAAANSFTTKSLRDQLSANYERISSYMPICMTTTATEAENYINSPHSSPATTPKRGNSPTNTNWQENLVKVAEERFETLNLPRSKLRNSYTLEQLLHLQKLQRERKLTLQDTQQLAEDIKQLSVHCITEQQLHCKPRRISYSTSPHNMGRTLSVLLAEEYQVDPHNLLKTQILQRQVESLRAKKRFLLTERQTYAERNTQLQAQLEELRGDNEICRNWLIKSQQELSTAEEELKNKKQIVNKQKHMKRSIMQHLEQRMSTLCLELREIYPIKRNQHGFYTVCGISVPNIGAYMMDAKYSNSITVEQVSPMAFSAALGYIAHLVQIISIIIDRPLR